MKTIELDSTGKSTAFSEDQAQINDIFREILPVIFHKLKNKMTPILGYAQILKTRATDDFTVERLGKIETNATELTALLNVLKDYFKAEPAAMRPGNINRILQDLKPHWQRTAAKNKIKIRLDLDPQVPEMPLHAGQIRLLLLNLTANAVTALQMKTAPQKEIRLSTRLDLEGGQLKLTVRDNGIGMRAEELDNIWAPFYTQYAEHGGLGLVICEKVIANHAAACRVTSAAGECSQFEITFPLPRTSVKKQKKSAGTSPRSRNIKEAL
jgi:signal transduction histidine kinase